MTAPIAPGGMELDGDKQAVVEHMRSHRVTVVTAGAGSGKTYAVVACLLDLIEHQSASLDQCALITFTNQGAEELRKRVEDKIATLAGESDGDIWRAQQERLGSAFIGTIHGFCSMLLRTYGFSERVPRSASTTTSSYLQRSTLFDIVETALTAPEPPAATAMLHDLQLAEHQLRGVLADLAGFCRSRGIALERLASLTATETQPDGQADGGRDVRSAIVEALVAGDAEYTMRKRADGIVDVDDLLLATGRLLSHDTHGQAIATRIAQRYPYLFVDEFQDTNPVQEGIIDALVPHLQRLVVVGDIKQAIFAFLAATPFLLRRVADKYGVTPCALTYAQRPTRELLQAQRALFDSIRRNGYEIDEQLEPRPGMRPAQYDLPTIHYRPAARNQDAAVVENSIISLLDDSGVAANEIAIVAATNRELADLEHRLKEPLNERGVGLQRAGGGLFGTPEVVATYQLLRVIADEHDEASLFEALHTPYLSAVDLADAIAQRLRGGWDAPPISAAFAATSAASMLGELRAVAREDTVPQLLTGLFDASQIIATYEAAGDLQQAANLLRLREYARELMRNEQALTLPAFVEHLQLAIALGFDEPEAPIDLPDEASGKVRLITIHGAKGQEWPVVVIPGMARVLNARWKDPQFIIEENAGLDIDLPRRSDGASIASPRWKDRLDRVTGQDVDEQFRLFYVAVTRAKEAVVLIGGTGSPRQPGKGEPVAWRDEVLRAQRAIETKGGEFDV